MIRQHGRGFAFGDTLTIADCHIVSQVYTAERFNVQLDAYPALMRATQAAREIPAVAAAHPDRQPDELDGVFRHAGR